MKVIVDSSAFALTSHFDPLCFDSIENYLVRQSINYNVTPPEKYEAHYLNEYHQYDGQTNVISGDFNCDSIPDKVWLINESESTVGLWLFTSDDSNQIVSRQLDRFTDIADKFGLFISSTNSETIDLRTGNGTTPDCDAIKLTFFEKASRVYYYDTNNFRFVETGD